MLTTNINLIKLVLGKDILPENFTGAVFYETMPNSDHNHIIYYLNGEMHNDDMPAAIYNNGLKYWFKYGNLHRLDGPAIIGFSGHRSEYWIDGEPVNAKNNEEFKLLIDLIKLKGLV